MISEFKEINNLFSEIDDHLQTRVELFVIGGAMLLYNGLKPATKDIDVIVWSKAEFDAMKHALKRAGFEAKTPTRDYGRMNLSAIYQRVDFRVDLFERTVCNKFSLSDAMRARGSKILQSDKLVVSMCSMEDVFLFKTMTEREGDLEDCIALAKEGLAWENILQELKDQTKHNSLWITWVGERLDLLRERGIDIPIMGEVDKLRDAYFEETYR